MSRDQDSLTEGASPTDEPELLGGAESTDPEARKPSQESTPAPSPSPATSLPAPASAQGPEGDDDDECTSQVSIAPGPDDGAAGGADDISREPTVSAEESEHRLDTGPTGIAITATPSPTLESLATIPPSRFDTPEEWHRIQRLPKDPFIGRELQGRFRLESKLGAGGMGTVYKARQLSVDRDVAVKLLPGEGVGEDLVKRFFQEARAASLLRSRHTITVIDFGESEDGVYWMAMELLRGESLYDVLRKGPLKAGRAARIARHICLSLKEAHARGIIHRDLKPANISLEPAEDQPEIAKVLDFGIAKWHGGSVSTATVAGSICGTPQYMSPEQCQALQLDARSDLYALGVVLFEMLTGRVPFDAPNPTAVVMAHVTQEPPQLQELAPKVPRKLAAIVHRLLEKDADGRYQSADEVMEALDATGLQGKPAETITTVQALPSIPEVDELAGGGKSRTALWVGLPAVLSFVIVGGLLLWAGGRLSFLPKPPAALAKLAGNVSPTEAPTPPKPKAEPPKPKKEPPPPKDPLAATSAPKPADGGGKSGATEPAAPGKDGKVAIRIESDPSPVYAIINGTNVRETPLTLDLEPSDKPISVVFRLPGYKEERREFTPDRTKTFKVRLDKK